MSLGMPDKQPVKLAGKEELVQLADETTERFHGALTRNMLEILEHATPNDYLLDDLARSLKEVFLDDVTIKGAQGARSQFLLAGSQHNKAHMLLERMDQQQEHQIIAVLEDMIKRRELQRDYWPEGRLNLGIAYACLGEYEKARRWLQEAVNMFRNPSYILHSDQMEMAA